MKTGGSGHQTETTCGLSGVKFVIAKEMKHIPLSFSISS